MRRVLLAIFGTIAGLVGLLSFKTHNVSVASPPAATSTTNPGNDDSTNSATGPAPTSVPSTVPASPSSAAPTSTGSASTGTKTVTGDSADTRWGPVQVKITVTNGKITSADAVVYPSENPRDQEINSWAIPALNKETVTADSAQIDTLSGATVTSDGYISSLQSALDKAGR